MKTVKISSFLREKKIKLKPQAANCSGLQRIEKIDFSGKIYLSPVQTNTDMILVKSGDLVISGINVEKGALAIYTGEEDVLASIHYSTYEFDAEKIDIDYLKWFLKSNIFRKLLLKQTGSGIKKEIKAKHLLPIEIHLPSLNRQHEIVRQIQGVADYIEEVNQQIQQQAKYAEMLRQSILQQAVEGKLCEQDTNDESIQSLLEEIKEEKIQRCKSLKDKNYFLKEYEKVISSNSRLHIRAELICDHITKGTTPKTHDLTEAGDIPFLKVYNIVNNKINFHYRAQFISFEIHNASLSRSKVYPNDILINIVGPPLGKVAIVPKEYPEWNINQALAIFRCLPQIMPEYLYIILAEGSAINKIATVGTAGQDNISLKQCRDIEIPIPVLAEQKRIVNKVKHLLTLCDKLEQTVFKAKDYASKLMEAILQEAFSVQETAKPAQVIEFYPDQTTPETELLAAARGKIREDTWEHLRKRALEIVGEES